MSRVERLGGGARIALSAASQSIANVVVALGAVIILRITTHHLGPANYGLFALVITYVTLFSLLTDVGITAMTTRELARSGADRSSVLSVALSSRVALSVLVIPIIFGTGVLLYPHKGATFHIALLVMSFDVLFTSVQVTANTAFAVRVRGDLISVISMTNKALYLVGVILVAVFGGSYVWYVASYVGADFIMALAVVVAARRSIAIRIVIDVKEWFRSIAAAFPLGVIQIVDNIYSWVDSILLSLLRSATELGFYVVAFNVVNVLGSMASFLMQALIPSLVNADRAEISRLVNRAVYVLVCVGAPLTVGGIVLRNEIVSVLAGSRFAPAATPLAILAATIPVSFLQTALSYTSVSIDRYRPLLIVGVATLGINVVTNLIVIPSFGPSGAASALLGTEVISCGLTYCVFRRLSGVRLRWKSLGRPVISAVLVLVLLPLRGVIWVHLSPLYGLLVGGTLVGFLYLVALVATRGVPQEVRALVLRSRRRRVDRP